MVSSARSIEPVYCDGELLCLLVPHSAPDATTFYTSPALPMQCGRIVYGKGSEIARHRHEPVERVVVGTAEVLLVEKGRVVIDLYASDERFVCSRELVQGDVVVLLSGGHGFRMLEDTVLLEVKQGPYLGSDDKRQF